ncbi:MAG: ABC transporter permease [Tannerella sp.]|jgi:ABC-2 type transport system permease protein|nr:ABC transporter permease [Tannerella sp.]
MRQLISLLYKDCLLLLRDRAGLCLLFLMPLALVVIMTYLQDGVIGAISENRISVLLLNLDEGSLGQSVEQQIVGSESFDVAMAEGDETDLVKSVAGGDYMIGVVVPSGISDSIRSTASRMMHNIFNGADETLASHPARIKIFIDPTLRAAFRNTLVSTMKEYAARTERDIMLQEMTLQMNRLLPFHAGALRYPDNQVVFDVEYALTKANSVLPNASQHNVPAWSLFAIFFITLSLAGNMIKERDDGSFRRLLTMPCPYFLYLTSKALVYLCVCLLQLALLFALGVWLFPHIGLPVLTITPDRLPLLLLMGVCSALAAIGYGILVGKITTGYQQSSIFAAVSIIIFAAIGGIWVPVFAMPAVMQTVSVVSPLNWGLDGFYDILIRGGNLGDIWTQCALSLAFAAVCIFFAVAYHRMKKL